MGSSSMDVGEKMLEAVLLTAGSLIVPSSPFGLRRTSDGLEDSDKKSSEGSSGGLLCSNSEKFVMGGGASRLKARRQSTHTSSWPPDTTTATCKRGNEGLAQDNSNKAHKRVSNQKNMVWRGWIFFWGENKYWRSYFFIRPWALSINSIKLTA